MLAVDKAAFDSYGDKVDNSKFNSQTLLNPHFYGASESKDYACKRAKATLCWLMVPALRFLVTQSIRRLRLHMPTHTKRGAHTNLRTMAVRTLCSSVLPKLVTAGTSSFKIQKASR